MPDTFTSWVYTKRPMILSAPACWNSGYRSGRPWRDASTEFRCGTRLWWLATSIHRYGLHPRLLEVSPVRCPATLRKTWRTSLSSCAHMALLPSTHGGDTRRRPRQPPSGSGTRNPRSIFCLSDGVKPPCRPSRLIPSAIFMWVPQDKVAPFTSPSSLCCSSDALTG